MYAAHELTRRLKLTDKFAAADEDDTAVARVNPEDFKAALEYLGLTREQLVAALQEAADVTRKREAGDAAEAAQEVTAK